MRRGFSSPGMPRIPKKRHLKLHSSKRSSPGGAERPTPARPPEGQLEYKVVELSTVDELSLEQSINAAVARGWRLEGIQFAMRESSKRPAMARPDGRCGAELGLLPLRGSGRRGPRIAVHPPGGWDVSGAEPRQADLRGQGNLPADAGRSALPRKRVAECSVRIDRDLGYDASPPGPGGVLERSDLHWGSGGVEGG